MGFKSDIEIAQEVQMQPITEIAAKAGIDPKYLEQYGNYKAKIDEKDGYSSVSVVLRMNILVLILFAPIYLISLFLIVPFPVMLIILYFAYIKPAKRLKETLEDLLLEK